MATDSTVAATASATDGQAPSAPSAPQTNTSASTAPASGGQPADFGGQTGHPLADIIGKPQSNEDAVLAALGITRDDEAQPVKAAAPKGDEQPSDEPAAEQPPAEGEQAPEGEQPDPYAQAQAEQAKRETLVLARRLAGRLKLPASVIAKMSEADLLAWYPTAAEQQKRIDDAFAAAKRAKASPQTSDPDADTGDGDEYDPPAERFDGLTTSKGSPSPYPGNKAAPDLDRFIAEQALDTEAASKLRSMFAQTTKSATKALEQERANLQQGLQAITAERFTTAKKQAEQEWPGLKDPQQYAAVVRWMEKHDRDGAALYGPPAEFHAHFRDACTVVFGPVARAQAQQAMLRKGRETLDSQPERPSTNAPANRDTRVTPEEYDRLAYEAAAQAGGTARFAAVAAKLPPNPRRA